MQKWEYLVVRIGSDYWGDSEGRQGPLPKAGGDWYNPGPLLASLGSQGWELVATTSNGGFGGEPKLYFKRPAAGVAA